MGAFHLARQTEPACPIFAERYTAIVAATGFPACSRLVKTLLDFIKIPNTGKRSLRNGRAFGSVTVIRIDLETGFKWTGINASVTQVFRAKIAMRRLGGLPAFGHRRNYR